MSRPPQLLPSAFADLANLPDIVGDGTMPAERLDDLSQHVAREIKRFREDPMTYGLAPNEAQLTLHRSQARHVMWVAANRVGKSTAGVRESLWRARGEHPHKKVRLSNLIVIGIPDYQFYTLTTEPILQAWLPQSWVIEDRLSTEKWITIRRIDGGECKIQIKTFEQGRKSWQGFEADFIWLDEEHPEDVYKEAFARIITSRGTMLQTFTPVEGLGWTYDRLYLPGKSGEKKVHVIEAALAEYDETKYLGIGRILVTHVAYEDVVRFAEEYPDDDERAIRVFGQFRARTGTIYKGYDPAIHRITGFYVPTHWHVWGAVDPGFNGFAATLYAQSPDGVTYVVSELFSQHEATATRLLALADLYRDVFEPTDAETEVHPSYLAYKTLGIPDPLQEPERFCVFFCDTEDPQTVLELNLEAGKQGVPLVFAQLEQGLKAVKAGILRIQQLLVPHPDRPTPMHVSRARTEAGEPLVYFFDTLASQWRGGEKLVRGQSRLLWEISRYRWKRPSKGKVEQTDEPDKESAGGAHALDTLRYAVMARMGPPAPAKGDLMADLEPWEREVWEDAEEAARAMEIDQW